MFLLFWCIVLAADLRESDFPDFTLSLNEPVRELDASSGHVVRFVEYDDMEKCD